MQISVRLWKAPTWCVGFELQGCMKFQTRIVLSQLPPLASI